MRRGVGGAWRGGGEGVFTSVGGVKVERKKTYEQKSLISISSLRFL